MNAPENVDALAGRLRAIVGDRGLVADARDREAHEVDWRGMYRGRAAFVVKPASTREVASVVAELTGAGVAIVPQGGNTSLCGASVPDASGTQVVVNLSRMNRVRCVDAANNAMTVEAGCILADLQRVADEHDRLFPLSLAAEGSCEIGGNLSTNAGGTGVLRYGNTRELVLGLEVVLPDGTLWEGLRALRKDNTGYDLKHLFIGAEGTLGIITAAVLKLFPKPRALATALVAVDDPSRAVQLLGHLRSACGDRVTGFEIMARICIDLVLKHIPGARDPFAVPHPHYVLVELSDSGDPASATALLEHALGEAAGSAWVRDAVICANEAQRRALWAIREGIPEAQKIDGESIKHDVSVPVSRVPELYEQAGRALAERFPGLRVVAFGHVGDGNIHYNCAAPAGQATAEFHARAPEVNRVVYDVVHALGGSISAEHGLGQLKRESIRRYKSGVELALMRQVKAAIDPRGLMNPGKVL